MSSITQKIFNLLKRPLVLVLLVLAIIYAVQHIVTMPSFKNWFKRKPLLIENTPLVITQVKQIAQLHTVQLYSELVVDSSILNNAGIANQALRNIGFPGLPVTEEKQLVLIVKGKVIAGIDLKKIKDEAVFVKDDSVSFQLPAAEILEVITNPSDIETFIEEGSWTDAEVRSVKDAARRKLLQEAAERQLVKQAADRSVLVIKEFLQSVGFKKIHVTVSPT